MSMSGFPSSTADHAGQRGHWRLVLSLMLIYSYAFVDRVVLALLVDPIKHDLHATDFQMSLLLGLAFAAFYGLFTIPSGHFVDRMNRRRLIAIASIGWAVMTIVCGTATTVTQLFIGRCGVGLVEAVVTPAAFSMIRDSVPARSRGLAFSIYALAPVLGGAVSLAGGGFLLRLAISGSFSEIPFLGDLAPWQATLVIVGLAGLPLSLLLLTFSEPQREHRGGAAGGGIVKGLVEACRYIAQNRTLYTPLILFAGVGAMMSFAHNAWFPTAIGRRFELMPQQVGPILGGVYLVTGTVGLLFGGFVMNALARRGKSVMYYAIVAVIATALGTAAACLSGSASIAFAFAGFTMIFLGISNPAGATTLSQATPPEMIGRVSAVYLLFQTLVGQTLGPLSVAMVGQRLFSGPSSIVSGLVVVQITCATIAVVCAVFLVRHFSRAATKTAR
jgi:MFS family permease